MTSCRDPHEGHRGRYNHTGLCPRPVHGDVDIEDFRAVVGSPTNLGMLRVRVFASYLKYYC